MPPHSAASISIRETLELLDTRFAALAEGVAEDRYALWLGSGISLGRVDGLRTLVARVLEFLRKQVTPASTCRFRKALTEALSLAKLSSSDIAHLTFTQPFEDWPTSVAITETLASNYARLLDIAVDSESDDYLLWTGIDVVSTYADSAILPDVEHLCIAALALEGAASEIATANWDGLVERAAGDLAGAAAIRVCVRQEDFRTPSLQSNLYKFHGCALRAKEDAATYRPLLVARQSQINSWASRDENATMVGHLTHLIVTKPTLMIGLSAQDANIQAIFAHGEAQMPWPWPSTPPAYVFSENALGFDQRGLLKNVYRAHYTVATRGDILDGALIRAYAKPLLVALLLHVLGTKLGRLIAIAPGALSAPDRASLNSGVLTVRNAIAAGAGTNLLDFVRTLIQHMARALMLFRDGCLPTTSFPYQPLSTRPAHHVALDAGLRSSGVPEFAIALGILGLGAEAKAWALSVSNTSQWPRGALRATALGSAPEVFFVANSHAALVLQNNELVTDDDDALLIFSSSVPVVMPRSPRGPIGRTGRAGLRQVSIQALLLEVANGNDLLQRFREEAAI